LVPDPRLVSMPMIEDVDIFKDSSRVLITLFEQLTVQRKRSLDPTYRFVC